jgi:protein CpxP
MKKIVIAVLVLMSVSMFAQEVQVVKKGKKEKREKLSPEERNQVVLDKMTKELNLDLQQQEQIKPIISEQNARMQAFKEQSFKDMSKEERKSFMQKRKEDKNANEEKLKLILSAEQFSKLKELEEANREKKRAEKELGKGGNKLEK